MLIRAGVGGNVSVSLCNSEKRAGASDTPSRKISTADTHAKVCTGAFVELVSSSSMGGVKYMRRLDPFACLIL